MQESYLKPTYYIDCDHPDIKETAEKLVGRCVTPAQSIKRIFFFVRDQIPYNMYAVSGNQKDYKASKILAAGNGFCIQKAVLFTALARAAGVPCRLVLAVIKNHLTPPEVVELLGTNLFFPHGYSQVLLGDRWINIAATYHEGLYARYGAAAPEFDGYNDTLLPQTDKAGQAFIEYVDHFGTFQDFPWDFILGKMPDYYDDRWKDWFSN